MFGPSSELAAGIEAAEQVPRAWHNTLSFASHIRLRERMLGKGSQLYIRLNDDGGEFIGVLMLDKPNLPDSLILSLARGDKDLFERMEQVSEPAKRPAAILFADLEASGDLSRRLSSRGHFELVGELTDPIDDSVVSGGGIVGRHAGDGGSALFLAEQFEASESLAVRAAVEVTNKIRAGAAELGPGGAPVQINVGIHWGSTLMIGQIAIRGRLEVTAMGDQMNECARRLRERHRPLLQRSPRTPHLRRRRTDRPRPRLDRLHAPQRAPGPQRQGPPRRRLDRRRRGLT